MKFTFVQFLCILVAQTNAEPPSGVCFRTGAWGVPDFPLNVDCHEVRRVELCEEMDGCSWTHLHEADYQHRKADAAPESRSIKAIVEDQIYQSFGYGIASSFLVLGDRSRGKRNAIVVDTLDCILNAYALREDLEDLVGEFNVVAIINTHSQPDHISGNEAFLDEDTTIYYHNTFLEWYQQTRDSYFMAPEWADWMYGTDLPDDTDDFPFGWINNGLNDGAPYRLASCPEAQTEPPFEPAYPFGDSYNVTLAGLEVQFYHSPGESGDQISAYIVDYKALFAADNMYRSIANALTPRGAPPRDLRDWINTIQRWLFLDPQPEVLCMQHGESVVDSASNIREILQGYLDYHNWVFDYTQNALFNGDKIDDVVENARLARIANRSYIDSVWFEDNYGSLNRVVRNVHTVSVGYFTGELWNLNYLPRKKFAKELLADRSDFVLSALQHIITSAHERNTVDSHRFALELVTGLMNEFEDDRQLEILYRNSLRVLGIRSHSGPDRNFYLTEAYLSTFGDVAEVDTRPEEILTPTSPFTAQNGGVTMTVAVPIGTFFGGVALTVLFVKLKRRNYMPIVSV